MKSIALTVGGSGRQDMFYLDSHFEMHQRGSDDQRFNLGGIFTSVPVAVATMGERPGVVIEVPMAPGASGAGGTPPATHLMAPAAEITRGMPDVRPLVQRLDVFGLGLDYAMYHKTLWGEPVHSLGPWERLGGIFTSAPAALALDGHIHVFGLGTDYSMFHNIWNGSAWSGWKRLGGFFSSAASVVSWGPGRMDVFARGADFSLRHRSFEGNAWTGGWQNLSPGGLLARLRRP